MATSATNQMVNPVEAITIGFRKYFDFGGRATRAEFWWWMLFLAISYGVLYGIERLVSWGGVFEALFSLATLLPTLTVTTRRLHDIGKSGWWQLGWYAIPLTAWLVAGILYVVGAAKEYGTYDASGGWHFDSDNVDWSNSEAIFDAFPAAAIILLAAVVISLAVIVWEIVWMVRKGETGQNRFSPDPGT